MSFEPEPAIERGGWDGKSKSYTSPSYYMVCVLMLNDQRFLPYTLLFVYLQIHIVKSPITLMNFCKEDIWNASRRPDLRVFYFLVIFPSSVSPRI